MEDKQTRNIIDMIRDDANNAGSKKNWKTFRDKLRLKRAGRAWTSSVPIPASDIQMPSKPNRMMIRRGSARYSSSSNDEEEEEESGNKESHESDGEANRHLGDLPDRQRSNRLLPVETDPDPDPNDQDPDQETTTGADEPISLMALLSTDGSNYEQHDECEPEEEEEEEVKQEHEDEIGDYNVCSECKGKHTKGAPIGPCGHMFCKHCTKEMQIGKGNCPACNNFILEILDIY